MAERKLASIQEIHHIQAIYTLDGEEAKNIELAHVLGWSLIVKKHEFQEHDLCVFFEVDSILPEEEWSEFLRKNKFRIKTMKLNNMRTNGQPVISQGLALPTHIIEGVDPYDLTIGTDVTEILGVTKYEVIEEWIRQGIKKGNFHPFIPKTDEKRVQSYPEALEQMYGLPYYITQKLDGTSCTVVQDHNGIHVYSRNMEVGEDSNYYQTALDCGIIDIVEHHPYRAIQGEIVGPNIQGNKLKLSKNMFCAFNIFDLNQGLYEDFKKFFRDCEAWNITTVPILESGSFFSYTLEELEEMAKGFYLGTDNPQEGIVVRPQVEKYSSVLGGRLSFKVLNVDFLLKEK